MRVRISEGDFVVGDRLLDLSIVDVVQHLLESTRTVDQ
jgi:hypothetical protein